MNTCDKYFWITYHSAFGKGGSTIELSPHMVDPETCTILDDPSKNTKLEWWIEVCYYEQDNDDIACHDWDLDCGGDTAEEAIDNLYSLVFEKYGEYSDGEG